MKELNGTFVQESDGGQTSITTTSGIGKMKNKSTKDKSKVAATRIRPVDYRPGGLQLLTSFGLTDAQLSKESISQLGITIKATRASLTDLDLSRTYMSLAGADMIKEALTAAGTNLIRLCATGNAFGDVGAATIAESVAVNRTLTHLDLSSNDITMRGLAVLSDACIANPVMHTLDIRCNLLSRQDIKSVESKLHQRGAFVSLKWEPEAHVSKYFKNITTTPSSKVLFSMPQLKNVELNAMNPTAMVHIADSTRMAANASVNDALYIYE